MFTTMAELYDLLCQIVETVTGRRTWSKSGIQSTPNAPYATVYISQGEGQVYDVVQLTGLTSVNDADPTLREVVWGAIRVGVEIEFYRDSTGATAQIAAAQFRNALHRDARNYDLWQVAGLSGDIRYVDMSAIFRADTENRAKIMFNLYVNILDPTTASTETDIYQIDQQGITIKCDEATLTKTIIAP